MIQSTPGEPFTLDRYRHILVAGQAAGYRFIDFSRLETYRETSGVCLLRHDCDNDLAAATRLARIEGEMGIRSTYFLMLRSPMYNLLNQANLRLARQLVDAGHAIGLHFDANVLEETEPESLQAAVDREANWLEEELGAEIGVVSFHQPSDRILNGDLHIDQINTYDVDDMAGFTYLSDTNSRWREGCPSQIFHHRRYPRIQLLVHPEWWTPSGMETAQKWEEMLRNNLQETQRVLLDRERTFNRPLEVRFHPTDPTE